MDYGHALEFGTFATPTNSPPDHAVELAVHAEQLGFDLVTLQDHPYQPRFHDTLTLLAWIGARTERVRLMANVHNLPLRPPAVLARAAASLDLLSDGRFDLGLGAGGFWDAIEAMGGRRLTPGQAVDALSEAIDIIRGLWDADNRDVFTVDGEHYSVTGAKRGPAPAHDIPIVLGALKPRMLRLLGAKADGWLPSLAYLQPGDIPKANVVIDAAATDAGRTPGDVRRLINIGGRFTAAGAAADGGAAGGGALTGPARDWVEQISGLALEHGFSTFVLASDDRATMREFAESVIPAVRAAVAEARRA